MLRIGREGLWQSVPLSEVQQIDLWRSRGPRFRPDRILLSWSEGGDTQALLITPTGARTQLTWWTNRIVLDWFEALRTAWGSTAAAFRPARAKAEKNGDQPPAA